MQANEEEKNNRMWSHSNLDATMKNCMQLAIVPFQMKASTWKVFLRAERVL